MAKNEAGKWLRRAMIVIILGSVVVGGFLLYPYVRMYLNSKENNMAIGANETAVVFIPTGADTRKVADLLAGGGIIKDADVFYDLALQKNYQGSNVVPGKYQVKGDMTNNDLINHLRAGNGRMEVKATFNNVHNLDELCVKITESLEVKHQVFCDLVQSDSVLNKFGFTKETVICLFIPDTYQVDWAIPAGELLNRMAAEYREFWTAERKDKAKARGLSQSQVATLASIVMMEQGKHPEEWPRIAGLYLNRLKKNMKLQSDPTVKYALGDWSIRRVLNAHLEAGSPYNTYKYAGLPPGPIVMATKTAMDAVLNAESHKYVYMCAKPEYGGLHNFAETYSQHKKYAAEYHSWLKKEGIR
jgi:UPF0755 protein